MPTSHTTRTRRLAVAVSVAALLTAACGGDKKKEEVVTPPPLDPTTTSTTAPPARVGTGARLTGLAADPAKLARPALIVKLDNAPKGQPQAGILQADVVVEEGVEGGITRFAAIFHSQDSEEVGPVRSARSADIAIASEL